MNTVHPVVLAGLRSPVLADYLIAVGLLRAVSRQCDARATLAWRPDGTPVLTTAVEPTALVRWFLEEFAPTPVIAPWNAASGFNDNGKSREAERVVATIEASTDPRFAELRAAVVAGRAVVTEGRARGWAGETMWAKAHKHSVLALARNRLPDAALPWMDTAAALTGSGKVGYNPLAGTGGNLGRQELSVTYLQQLLKVIGPGTDREKSTGWFRAVLSGVEEVPYDRGAVGQFDPGRAGGIHSSIFGEPDKAGFVNPWRIILTCEGLVLFASSVARRNALDAGAANPFIVRSTPYGYASASAEKSKGELWAPVWEQPAALCELEQLLGEGRVRHRGRQARDGFDFARAAGSLGAGRGVRAFRRFVFVERLGQNPLAVHAGDIRVGRRTTELGIVEEAFDWLARIPEDPKKTPASVLEALHRAKASMFTLAAGSRDPDAELLRFVHHFGRLHETIARTGKFRDSQRPFLPRRTPSPWNLQAATAETRLAVALAGIGGRTPALRTELTRIQRDRSGALRWLDHTPVGVDLGGHTLAVGLAAVHLRRLRHLAEHRTGQTAPAFAYSEVPHLVGVDLVQDFLDHRLDDQAIADTLRGLLILGWRIQLPEQEKPRWPIDAELATLLPFYGNHLGPVRRTGATASDAFTPVLRPVQDWPVRLKAGRTDAVIADAQRRLRQAGCPPVPLPTPDRDNARGTRLAAALLLPVPAGQRSRALTSVTETARLPRPAQAATHTADADPVADLAAASVLP